ncbi:MAG: methyl-accepting chemotaxis protein [Brevinema sp.]
MSNEKTSAKWTPSPEAKKTLRTFSNQVYSICLLMAIPFTMLKEIVVNVPSEAETEAFSLHAFLQEFLTPHFILFYSIVFVVHFIACQIYIHPIKQYLKYNKGFEAAQRRFDNMGIMLWVNVIAGFFATLIMYFVERGSQKESLFDVLVITSLYRVFWQILTGYLIVFGLLQANNTIEHIFGKDYHKRTRKTFGTAARMPLLYLILAVLMSLNFYETILTLNEFSIKSTDMHTLNYFINYNNSSTILVLLCCIGVIYLYNNAAQKTKQAIYHFLDQSADSGLVEETFFYQEKNTIGSLIQALNNFINTILEKFRTLFASIAKMIEHRKKFSDHISNFSATISQQTLTFSDLALSKKAIHNNMEHLVNYIDGQNDLFENVGKHIRELTINTEAMAYSFDHLTKEYAQCLLSTEETENSLGGFIKNSGSIKSQLEEIYVLIESTDSETNNITEMLETIKNIAEQTKLLSISASIEAAHGGSSSSDFSSVAEEIRVLANMSHDAVNNIAMRLADIKNFIELSMELSIEGIGLIDHNVKDSSHLNNNLSTSFSNTQKLEQDINSFIENTTKTTVTLLKGETAASSINNFVILLKTDMANNQPISSDLHEYLEYYKSLILYNERSLQKLDNLQHEWQIKEFQTQQIISRTINEKK